MPRFAGAREEISRGHSNRLACECYPEPGEVS